MAFPVGAVTPTETGLVTAVAARRSSCLWHLLKAGRNRRRTRPPAISESAATQLGRLAKLTCGNRGSTRARSRFARLRWDAQDHRTGLRQAECDHRAGTRGASRLPEWKIGAARRLDYLPHRSGTLRPHSPSGDEL